MEASLIVLLVLLSSVANADVWCKNPKGEKVEWWLIYKVPKTLLSRGSTAGTEYGYIDSATVSSNSIFTAGNDGIFSEKNNPLANSLAPLFVSDKSKTEKNLVYIAYNDQPPHVNRSFESSHEKTGHTKGTVIFSETSGLWLVHSVPKFPGTLFTGKYSFPSNGHINGQTLLCMTFHADSLNTIAAHLRRQEPTIFDQNLPDSFEGKYPELDSLIAHKFSKDKSIVKNDIQGIQGTPFLAFAKCATLNDDVYSAILGPALKSDLFVSSWQNGEGGKLPADCQDKFKVNDVTSVAFNIGESRLKWLSKHDHSKWAVTADENSSYICIGSINRMHSQFDRGGETVCLKHSGLHRLFLKGITDFAPCDKQL